MGKNTASKMKPNENTEDASRGLRLATEAVSNDLDKVIHERMRLGIMSALAANAKLSFNELRTLLGTSDGNISVHARKLEDAGYLNVKKSFAGRVPLTEYKITADGRRALEKYLDHMEALINAMRGEGR